VSTEQATDDFMDEAASVATASLDLDAIAGALRAQYERGRDDCRREMLGEILAKVSSIAEAIEPGRPVVLPPPVVILPPAEEERALEPRPRPEPPAADSAARGGAQRPPNIPTTFKMAREVLLEEPGLTAREVANRIERRWWPGLRFNQIGPEFYSFVSSGRMQRDADGKLSLTERGLEGEVVLSLTERGPQDGVVDHATEETRAPPHPATINPRPDATRMSAAEVVAKLDALKRPMASASRKVEVAPPPPCHGDADAIRFEHSGRSTMLRPREHAVVSRLGVNAGWLPFPALFGAAFTPAERHPRDAEAWLRDAVPPINAKLRDVGLQMKLVPKMGYALTESTT
jgi:hypothetical protein